MVLFLTICSQILKQWRAGASRDVSPLLFLGQFVASSGFLLYSWLIASAVFVATNALMAVSALVGLAILVMHRRRRRSPEAAGGECSPESPTA
jgi:uncharacterized protein with PQ loop repeat